MMVHFLTKDILSGPDGEIWVSPRFVVSIRPCLSGGTFLRLHGVKDEFLIADCPDRVAAKIEGVSFPDCEA